MGGSCLGGLCVAVLLHRWLRKGGADGGVDHVDLSRKVVGFRRTTDTVVAAWPNSKRIGLVWFGGEGAISWWGGRVCKGGTNGSVISVIEAPVLSGFAGEVALISGWGLGFEVARRLLVVMLLCINHLF